MEISSWKTEGTSNMRHHIVKFSGTKTHIGQTLKIRQSTGSAFCRFLLGGILIITNNPKVAKGKWEYEVIYLEQSYLSVLERVRDEIHKGALLLMHPLYGSIKPNQSPYRSIVLKVGSGLDEKSLYLIEDALQKTKDFLKDKRVLVNTKEILEDYQEVDFDLFSQAIKRL